MTEEKWREQVTKLLNSMEKAMDFISGKMTLSDNAAALGTWLSRTSETGWCDIWDYDEIAAQFPEATTLEILESAGELELEGMATISHAIGHHFAHLRATHRLFEAFDPIIFPNVSPRADPAVIAQELLAADDMVSADELCAKHGWSDRRINPALEIVGNIIADGRKSQPVGQPCVICAMFVDPQERAKLRRFVNQVAGK